MFLGQFIFSGLICVVAFSYPVRCRHSICFTHSFTMSFCLFGVSPGCLRPHITTAAAVSSNRYLSNIRDQDGHCVYSTTTTTTTTTAVGVVGRVEMAV